MREKRAIVSAGRFTLRIWEAGFSVRASGQGRGWQQGLRAEASPHVSQAEGLQTSSADGSPDHPAPGFSWAEGLLWSRGRTMGNLFP